MSGIPEDIAQAVKEEFSESEQKAYNSLMGATAALINVGTVYIASAGGSEDEDAAGRSLDRMIAALLAQPKKAKEMIESLLAVITYLHSGGTLEDWFAPAGIQVIESEVVDMEAEGPSE